ncbi:uncharacterized protein FA14DRAFT_160833 [Meira miltonrushii]|uniref:Uncharacterized protein n=1 Tax=Meira miltonrushii TaxID=1280837 RepID=A0A316VEA2_9BASI|nr:uncharacterized protein FA14DRAFT_160833 [Meira miltonrushii]PWN35840.1 hypothetical protein FA14DRAFT_160833 [Meira miltonrushii]
MVDKTSADAIQRQKKKHKGNGEPSIDDQAGVHPESSSTQDRSTYSHKKSKKKDSQKSQSDIVEHPAESRSNNDEEQRKKKKKKKNKDKQQSDIDTSAIDALFTQDKEKSKKRKGDEEDVPPNNVQEPNSSSPHSKKSKSNPTTENDSQASLEAITQDDTSSNSKGADKGEKKKKKSKKNKIKQADQAPSSSVAEGSSSANGHEGQNEETDGQIETDNNPQESDATPQKKNKADVQDRLTALMKNEESKVRGVVHRSNKPSSSRQTTRQTGSNRKTNKEYFLSTLDKSLTHEDMLAKELFYYNQLRWLEEERGLKVKKGPFDKSEEQIIKNELDECKTKLNMDDKTFNDFVLEKREDSEQAKNYSNLWQSMTAKLVGRPNRSVRTHVRRNLTNYVYKTGPWTEEEQRKLEEGVKEHGLTWSKISKEINRSPEHCRLRWRDYKGDGKLQRQKGKWSTQEDEKLRKAVEESEQELQVKTVDEEKGNEFWDHVCAKMEGARSGRQCESRWRIMNPKDGQNTFYSQPTDGPILLHLLSEQANEARNDNFSDVNLKKIIEIQPNWTVKIIKRAWRSMVDRFVVKKGQEKVDHYQDFRNRLSIIKESMQGLEKQKVTEESKKRKRKPSKRDDEDLVESDNEVDLLTRNGDEEGAGGSSEKTKTKKKKSGSKEKRRKKGEESDDSIGGVSD